MHSKKVGSYIYRTVVALLALLCSFCIGYGLTSPLDKVILYLELDLILAFLRDQPGILLFALVFVSIPSIIIAEFLHLFYPHFPRKWSFVGLLVVLTPCIVLLYNAIYWISI